MKKVSYIVFVLLDAFYATEENIHNVDVMTDASGITAFTRYTVAPTTASKSSKYIAILLFL